MRKRIQIPAPKAVAGELVSVLNYRCSPHRWEAGIVEHSPTYSLAIGLWVYRVRLVRRTRGSRYLQALGESGTVRLTVNDNGIRSGL